MSESTTPTRPMAPALSNRKAWVLPPEMARVGPLVRELAGHLEGRGVLGRPLFIAQLVAEELVTNTIRHGGLDPRCDKVELRLEVDATTIRITVEDAGSPFDPSKSERSPDPAIPLEKRALGGHGLHLVNTLASELRYERTGNRNVLSASIARG